MTHPIIDRAFPIDPAALLPAITPDNTHYWEGLARGELSVQQCSACERHRYPIVPVCPYCQSTQWQWRALSGRGKVFSWVRYHRSYLPEFEDVMPYCVITAELAEGVRMFGRLTDRLDRSVALKIGAPVELVIERWPGGRCVPAFKLAGKETS